MTIRRTLAAVSLGVVAAAALAAFPLAAFAQSMTLKAADVHPAGYPNVVASTWATSSTRRPTAGSS